MRTEIYIEGRRLDLTEDLSVEFTYQIDDIKEFGSRETNFSKTVVLPGTANNNKLFGFVFEFGSQNAYDENTVNRGYNFNASKAATCYVYVDKIQIMKGVIRLLEIVRDGGEIEYECAIFGELGGFVNALGNSKIEDLDFSAYDHEWTMANITGSWEPTTGISVSGVTLTGYYPASGYFYPLIDYGAVSTNKKDWDFRAYRPALYVKEYLRKIIAGSGYTYESDFFDTQLFHRLVVPNNQKVLKRFTSTGLSVTADPRTYTNVGNVAWIAGTLGDFTLNAPKTIFTYNSATPFTGTLDVVLMGEVLEAGTSLEIEIRKNGVSIYTHINSANLNDVVSVNASIGGVTFNQNDTLSVYIDTDIRGLGIQITEGTLTLISATPTYVTLGYGDEIAINDTIPRGVFQRDFFSSVVKMFNLYVTESTSREKHLIIQPYRDYYEDALTVLATDDFTTIFMVDQTNALLLEDGSTTSRDWTYRLDRSKPIRLKPMSELNGRYFEYKYKPDADYYNEQYLKKFGQGYGDYLEDSGYEFAKEKQTAELIFSASALVGYTGEDKKVSTMWKLSGTTEDKTEHNIRILQIKKKTGVTSYDVKDGGTVKQSLTTYGYGGHLDDPDTPQSDINFGTPEEIYFNLTNQYPSANLFTGFWFDYVAEITDKDSKLMTAYFRLNEMDIYGLDFARLIYIDGALWRLNRIIDFNPLSGESTKVELLKVMELSYE
jgi:hypothetical protein